MIFINQIGVWTIMTSVIVVDDNEDIVSSLSDLLEFHKIDVVGTGSNGLECVELYDALRPDVVLLDLQMPEYDGLYALRKIREKYATAIILIITGGFPQSMNDELDSLRPTKIIFKPVNVNILIETILNTSNSKMPFKIKYTFKEDPKSYTCILTYDQYKNFKKLPIIHYCEIIKKDEKNIEAYKNEMQLALNLAAKNDVSHIQKLSETL